MKKLLMTTVVMAATLSTMADEYPYLTFETADGTKTSVSIESLTISIQDGKLMVGSQEFSFTDLSKMYFSVSDETTDGIEEVSIATLDEITDIYDLQGRKVNGEQMQSGIYVIKTKKGILKVSVK